MVQYIKNIIVPYIQCTSESYEEDTPALVIYDNFKGQITKSISDLLEANNTHVCLIPANTTDKLQPIDLSVNQPAKAFLKDEFELWCSERVIEQREGRDLESTELEPISLDMVSLKELMVKRLVQMAIFFADNPSIIVNGFIKSGTTSALDGEWDKIEEEESKKESDTDDDFDEES